MNAMTINDPSGIRSVSSGQLPEHGREASQHNETSVEGRLGENHGGVERPMDPVSCRTPECIPDISGGVEDKYGKTITNDINGLISVQSLQPVLHTAGGEACH